MFLDHLADFKPPASSRAWLSAPHPTLPLVATACADKTVRVYSLSNFTLHSNLDGGHKRSVRSVAWKPGQPKGQLALVTGSFDATAGIWRRDESAVREQNFTADTGGEDETDEEHDWEFSLVLEGHDSEIKSVAFSPSGQYLATCSRDKSVWIWEEIGEEGDDEWETVAVLQEHDGDVKYISWCGDDGKSEVLASASYDDTVRLWREDEDREWACCTVLRGHEGTVWAVEWEGTEYPGRKELLAPVPNAAGVETSSTTDDEPFHPPRLITCSADGSIRIWKRDLSVSAARAPAGRELIPSTMRMSFTAGERWDCEATLPKVHDGDVYSIAWSPRTGRVVSAGSDGKIVIYGEVRREVLQPKDNLNGDHGVSGPSTTAAVSEEQLVATGNQEASPTSIEAVEKPLKKVSFQDPASEAAQAAPSLSPEVSPSAGPTEWHVLATMSKAHGPFEVNHVAWTKRFDARGSEGEKDEEVIISTGDDGSVIAWHVVEGEGEKHRVGRETGKGWGDAIGQGEGVPDLI